MTFWCALIYMHAFLIVIPIQMQNFKKGHFPSIWNHDSTIQVILHMYRSNPLFQMGVPSFSHLPLEKDIGCYHWCRHTGFPPRFFLTSWSSHWTFCQARQIMSPLDFLAASSKSSGSWCDHGYCYIYTKWQLNSVDGPVPRPAVTVGPELIAAHCPVGHLPGQNPFQLDF